MHGGKIALYVIAILWTVVTLFPVVVTVMASFKTNSEIYLNLLSFPKKMYAAIIPTTVLNTVVRVATTREFLMVFNASAVLFALI